MAVASSPGLVRVVHRSLRSAEHAGNLRKRKQGANAVQLLETDATTLRTAGRKAAGRLNAYLDVYCIFLNKKQYMSSESVRPIVALSETQQYFCSIFVYIKHRKFCKNRMKLQYLFFCFPSSSSQQLRMLTFISFHSQHDSLFSLETKHD